MEIVSQNQKAGGGPDCSSNSKKKKKKKRGGWGGDRTDCLSKLRSRKGQIVIVLKTQKAGEWGVGFSPTTKVQIKAFQRAATFSNLLSVYTLTWFHCNLCPLNFTLAETDFFFFLFFPRGEGGWEGGHRQLYSGIPLLAFPMPTHTSQ